MTKEQLLEQAKPILFNTEMVRAILDGRKTATRRLVKQPYFVDGDEEDSGTLQVLRTAPKGSLLYRQIGFMPYPEEPYRAGDILYVRETWQDLCLPVKQGEQPHDFAYKAGSNDKNIKWRPSIHMPKEAARIFLRVTDVRVERLQDITEEKAKLEGAIDNRGHIHSPDNAYDRIHSAREHFAIIWNSTIPKAEQNSYSWEANP